MTLPVSVPDAEALCWTSPAPSYQLESVEVPVTSALPLVMTHCPLELSVCVREPVLDQC